jgi:hypothetical protein
LYIIRSKTRNPITLFNVLKSLNLFFKGSAIGWFTPIFSSLNKRILGSKKERISICVQNRSMKISWALIAKSFAVGLVEGLSLEIAL